jgi:hypothetical protein
MHEQNGLTPFSFTYKLGEGFLSYLDETRPGVAEVLRTYNVQSARVAGTVDGFGNTGRYLMSFYGVPCGASEHFDRQAHSEHACVVLDEHPARLAAGKNLDFVVPQEGLSCLIDPGVVQQRLRDKRVGVPVRILRREGYVITAMTEAEGYVFILDADELRCWHRLWVKPVSDNTVVDGSGVLPGRRRLPEEKREEGDA